MKYLSLVKHLKIEKMTTTKKYKVISVKNQGIYAANELIRFVETNDIIKTFPALEFNNTFYDNQYNECRAEEVAE